MALVSNIKHYLWRVLMERMHLDFTLRSGITVIIRNFADWCIYNELFVNGEYSEAIDDVLAEWKPKAGAEPLNVLDLGANMGYFTLQFANSFLHKCPVGSLSVRLVEASSKVAAELTRRLVIPGGRVDAKIINGLVGKREGAARLNLGKEDTVNFVGQTGDGGDGGEWEAKRGAETVNYVDLDAVAAQMPVIDLIKCDIEGSEFAFLENYPELLGKARRAVIEFHSPFGDIARATETVKKLGFRKASVLRESKVTPTIYFARD